MPLRSTNGCAPISLALPRPRPSRGLYDDQGRLEEAEALYKRALAINEALPTEVSPGADTGRYAESIQKGKLPRARRSLKDPGD